MARAVLPLGKFIFAASQIKLLLLAHATSLALFILKCQVRVAPAGRDAGSVTSASVRIITVALLFLACAMRLCCVGVSTAASFNNSPLQTTIWLAGAVMFTSKSPYSK